MMALFTHAFALPAAPLDGAAVEGSAQKTRWPEGIVINLAGLAVH